jgi:hypothetical protein
MMKNFSFWRLPAGVVLWFTRRRNDGRTWRSFHFAGLPIYLSVSALTWTRAAYYMPCEEQRRGHWKRWRQTLSKPTLNAVWHGTGRVRAAYCPAQPKAWGGIALALPRLNVYLDWESPAFRRKFEQHTETLPCQACADAGWTQNSIVRET